MLSLKFNFNTIQDKIIIKNKMISFFEKPIINKNKIDDIIKNSIGYPLIRYRIVKK